MIRRIWDDIVQDVNNQDDLGAALLTITYACFGVLLLIPVLLFVAAVLSPFWH